MVGAAVGVRVTVTVYKKENGGGPCP
jgi:hypothetical protein